MIGNKCEDFEVSCMNSDGLCFKDDIVESKVAVLRNPKICDHCVYNPKFKNYTYEQWEEYKEALVKTTTMETQLDLYKMEFDPINPVPYGLLILAWSEEQAMEIASKTLTHCKPKKATIIRQDEPKVVFFESGEY